MPRKICPICNNGYISYVKQVMKFRNPIYKIYSCDNCGDVLYDVRRDSWSKGSTINVPVRVSLVPAKGENE